MITENNIKNLKVILSNLSYRDYVEAYRESNRFKLGKSTPSGKERKFKGYSLSAETQKVYNLLNCALKGVLKEEEIKEYLLDIKLNNNSLLKDGYMENYYNILYKGKVFHK